MLSSSQSYVPDRWYSDEEGDESDEHEGLPGGRYSQQFPNAGAHFDFVGSDAGYASIAAGVAEQMRVGHALTKGRHQPQHGEHRDALQYKENYVYTGKKEKKSVCFRYFR